MKTIKIPVIVLILVSLSALSANAELFPIPNVKNGEEIHYFINPKEKEQYVNKKWGIDVANTLMKITNLIEETPSGKKLIMINEGNNSSGGSMVITNEFMMTPKGLKQIVFDKKIIDKRNNEVVFHYSVDFEKMSSLFPHDTYTSEVFSLVMRGLDFEKKPKLRFHWWGSERSVVPLYTKIKKPKDITVKAGTFTCYRVETWADLSEFARIGNFLMKLASPFLPVYVNYFDVKPPHNFIAFEGPIGPPGSPEVFFEMMEIKTMSNESATRAK